MTNKLYILFYIFNIELPFQLNWKSVILCILYSNYQKI